MLRSICFLSISFLFLLAGCTNGVLDGTGEYPTELQPLSQEEYEDRLSDFLAVSKGRICSELDAYGFTTGGSCIQPDQPGETIDSAGAMDILRSEIIDYHRFTNLKGTTDLTVIRARKRPLGEWLISLAPQTVNGLTVRNSSMEVWLSSEGIYRIDGHRYPNMIIPESNRFSREEALSHLVGHPIHYSDWGGEQTYHVEADHLPSPSDVERVIVPHEQGDRLQLRVAWSIPVPDEEPWWIVYMDVMDGQVLAEDQLIVF